MKFLFSTQVLDNACFVDVSGRMMENQWMSIDHLLAATPNCQWMTRTLAIWAPGTGMD
jgi:hypothetical protein